MHANLDVCAAKNHNEGLGKHQDLIITLAAMAGLFGFLYMSLGGRIDGLERRIDALHGDVRILLQSHLPPADHQHSNGD